MDALFGQTGQLGDRERRTGWYWVGAFAAFLVVLWVFPHTPVDGVVLCPFRAITGYSCPGCGMTRACVHLAHGDLGASLGYHPFGVLFVVSFGLIALHRLIQNLLGRHVSYPGQAFWKRHDNPVLIGCLVFLLGFSAVRLGLEITGFLTPV